ncbi:hypothetical protein Ancab_019305 [Ancistrocladus abbreviatus]
MPNRSPPPLVNPSQLRLRRRLAMHSPGRRCGPSWQLIQRLEGEDMDIPIEEEKPSKARHYRQRRRRL